MLISNKLHSFRNFEISIYENYDEDLQAFNGTGVILTSEEIKELFNCKGEWEVTDGVTDMSF